jgi:hypothetical protein
MRRQEGQGGAAPLLVPVNPSGFSVGGGREKKVERRTGYSSPAKGLAAPSAVFYLADRELGSRVEVVVKRKERGGACPGHLLRTRASSCLPADREKREAGSP